METDDFPMKVGKEESGGKHTSILLISLTFFLSLAGTGAWLPYLVLHLKRTGHDGAEVGLLLGILPVARLLSAPLWAMVGDRYRKGSRVLQATTLLSPLAATALLFTENIALMALSLLVFSAARGPIGPLMDAQAVDALVARGRDTRTYGRIRLWGSFGFLVAGFVAGFLADAHPRAPLQLALLLWFSAFLLTLGFSSEKGAGPAPIGPALKTLLARPFFAPFLLASVLHGVSLTSYDAFFALHVASLGLSSRWTGMALVTGVGVEMVVMAGAPWLMKRFSPFSLVMGAMGVGVFRFALTATVTSPIPLVALQCLHGISFGAFWIGGVELLAHRSPPQIRASSQALFTSATYGMGPLLSAALASFLLDREGTAGLFWVCAVGSGVAAGLTGWARSRELGEQEKSPSDGRMGQKTGLP